MRKKLYDTPADAKFLCISCSYPLRFVDVKVFERRYYCAECHEAKVRRQRLEEACKDFDTTPDETIE